jgi:hypothetical protein
MHMHQPLFCFARIDIRFAKALTKFSLAARDPAFAAWQVEMESLQEDMCNGFVANLPLPAGRLEMESWN